MKTIMSKKGLGGVLVRMVWALAFMVCTGHSVPFVSAASSGFPKPDYDSGWVMVERNGPTKVLTHNLGGNVDDYLVDLQAKVGGPGMSPWVTNVGVGYSFCYNNLTTTSLNVGCWGDYTELFDAVLDTWIRVRIWVCGDQADDGSDDDGGSCTSTLTDSQFSASVDSADLRADSAGQDWYESRQDEPSLVTLNVANIGGNSTPKAAFTASSTGNAYLTQEFCRPITLTADLQWDIYVDSILNLADDPDRAAWMLIGDDTGTDPTRVGPNAEDSERFVYLGFAKNGGGTTGTMDLVARDRDDPWSTFTTIASGLSLGRWYTIEVFLNVAAGTYQVYVDGNYKATVTSRNAKSRVTHISFAQWNDGAGSFYVDNVEFIPQ